MPRSTVLVATTNPAMAYALRAKLDKACRELDLRLEICPGGDEKDDDNNENLGGVRIYHSAGALFDHLESLPPMALADTLVVLDVGVELEQAFEPSVQNKEGGWHATDGVRAGVAVELILRFPQVFPVILSPAVPVPVPVSDQPIRDEQEKVVEPASDLGTSDKTWRAFHQLRNSLCIRNMPIIAGESEPICEGALPAFFTPLHFVSPLDEGRGLASTLARFARGMRCWFDPTGLRTLVRNRFLGACFGNDQNWKNTTEQREVLLERLVRMAVAVDEEREFAMFNAYFAYKFGRRAWVVTTFAEFDTNPLWAMNSSFNDTSTDVVILRDVDLRFPDIPGSPKGAISTPLRDQLGQVHSDVWCKKFNGDPRMGSNWRIRAVTSHANVEEHWTCTGVKGDGVMADGRLCGLAKPISSLYELKKLLADASFGDQVTSMASLASLITPVQETASGGHGAPYLNLAMAESLLQQAGHHEYGPTENLLGAFLAGEAYELLLGMSKTTALEALLMQHKREVIAEGEFPGIAQATSIEERKRDIEKTIESLLSSSGGKQQIQSVTDLFLVKFWAELKLAYRNGEQFHAAEEANAQSLIHGDWLKRFPEQTRKLFAAIPFAWRVKVKTQMVRIVTSFGSWVGASVLSASLFALAYASVKPQPWENMANFFLSVILSSITLQPMTEVQNILSPPAGECVNHSIVFAHIVGIAHMGVSYLLFGVLISMLYRKVTRG